MSRNRESGKIDVMSMVLGCLLGALVILVGYDVIQRMPNKSLPNLTTNTTTRTTSSSGNGAFLSMAENTIADIAEEASKSVVNINVRTNAQVHPMLQMMGIEMPPQEGVGSGIIVKSNGYILTNYHVVGDASEILVTLNDKRQFKGKVVGKDAYTDLAAVKIDANDLPVAKLGVSKTLRPGDWVIAIGSPMGIDHTVTMGIISGVNRNLVNEGSRVQLIQTDAAINQGNSGGPLINIHGEVVGMNELIFNPRFAQNMCFAIPVDVFKEVSDQLISGQKVLHPWVGLGMQDINDDLANAMGLPKDTRGVVVIQVVPDSPAEQSNLALADVIQKIDGKEVNSAQDVKDLIKGHKPKDRMSFLVLRAGKLVPVDVIVGEFKMDERRR